MAQLFLLLPLFFGTASLASPMFPSSNQCRTPDCADSHRILNLSELSLELRTQLQRKAEEFAGIWGDTILEGDYYADEQVSLDQVEEMTRANTLVSYRITYSSRAWDTSTCDFDYSNLSTLDACEAGRIVESGYVSGDFKSFERDPTAFATFQKN